MTREEFKAKSGRYALAAMWAFALLILYFLIQTAITVYFTLTGAGKLPVGQAAQNNLTLLYSLFFSAIMLAVMVLSLRLVLVIHKGESPFTLKNARSLRQIGWLLLLFEPLQWLITHLFWRLASGFIVEDGTVEYYFNSSGGMILMVGLAVLAISYVFQYGVELQKLSDETL